MLLEEASKNKYNNSRASILGYPVDLVDIDEAVNLVDCAIKSAQGKHIITINPEMIMQAIKNPDLSRILKNADLIIPDGVGVVAVLKTMGIKHINRLPGIEFSQALISISANNNYRLAFIGASPDVIQAMSANLKSKYSNINIVYTRDGYFNQEEESQIVEDIKQSKPDVVFVALGVPKQEIWIEKYRNQFSSAIMVGVGGSFDVWANKVKRAPLVFRKLGLEWFHRLITQPSRFSRMFPTLPLFFIKVMLDKKNTRKEY